MYWLTTAIYTLGGEHPGMDERKDKPAVHREVYSTPNVNCLCSLHTLQ